MKTHAIQFSDLVDQIYGMPLEDKIELKNLLEHNISEARREEHRTQRKQNKNIKPEN